MQGVITHDGMVIGKFAKTTYTEQLGETHWPTYILPQTS